MKQHSSRFENLVTDVKTRIQEITVQDVKNKLENGEVFYLIDVREQEEWIRSYVPLAMPLSKGILERDIEKFVSDDNAEIIVYCGGGYRSALAAEALQKMGYQRVFSMKGGFGAWLAAEYPVEK